jgi:hypothetical protein
VDSVLAQWLEKQHLAQLLAASGLTTLTLERKGNWHTPIEPLELGNRKQDAKS